MYHRLSVMGHPYKNSCRKHKTDHDNNNKVNLVDGSAKNFVSRKQKTFKDAVTRYMNEIFSEGFIRVLFYKQVNVHMHVKFIFSVH